MSDEQPIRYARRDGVSIAYTVTGEGPVDLLFIGGFVSHLDIIRTWPLPAAFLDRLASFARVIVFDKRNQGLSDAGPYTLEDVAADAIAVLDDAGIERVSLFGVSEGGGACTLLAATRPDRIEAMVQYGTWARVPQEEGNPHGVDRERVDRTWGGILENWGTGEGVEMFAPSVADDPEFRAWWARLLRAGASPAAARTMVDMYMHADVRPLLGSVSVPSLILWRGGDKLVPPGLSAAVAEGIPGAQSRELRGSDHVFFVGDQEALIAPIEEFLTGRPASRPTRRILTTVLFVDIVDSTRRAAELGDGPWRDLLARFDTACQAAVEREHGRRVKSTGDGMLATFDGPSQAARAALAIEFAARTAGIDVRAGVHTGECEVIGEDIGGIAVHIASRIESSAAPGEVLASRTVRDLAIGSGLEFADRGSRELKGVPGEWELFSVAQS
jgi:class 3 adenylate cyclase